MIIGCPLLERSIFKKWTFLIHKIVFCVSRGFGKTEWRSGRLDATKRGEN